jgi:hypothetical protein
MTAYNFLIHIVFSLGKSNHLHEKPSLAAYLRNHTNATVQELSFLWTFLIISNSSISFKLLHSG